MDTHFGYILNENKVPIVYSSYYNITFGGLEKLHPFDSTKWNKIMKNLFGKSQKMLSQRLDFNNMDMTYRNNSSKHKLMKMDKLCFTFFNKNNQYIIKENISTQNSPTENPQGSFKEVSFNIKMDQTEGNKPFPKDTMDIRKTPSKMNTKYGHMYETGINNSIPNNTTQIMMKNSAPENIYRKPIIITEGNIFDASEATEEEISSGHSDRYLQKLKSSYAVAKIIEVPFLAIIPMFLINRLLLKKFRYHVRGTILAAKLALEYQWAINVGGGFHHASRDCGGGFCVYADISIAIVQMKKEHPDCKFMIIDLDAHQGNGHETDFKYDNNVFIFDMFNDGIYPHDMAAKGGINLAIRLMSHTSSEKYLRLLHENLEKCFQSFSPNLIIYNAGTDCLLGDPLGRLNITRQGIIDRDEMVFRKAKEMKCPIAMVTSGGYQMSNADIIADSIWNLFVKEIIS